MTKARLTWLELGLIALAGGGIIYAAHRQWGGLKLSGEVKTIEVFTLAVNLTIAWALQNFLTSRATNSRAEKDFLIEVVKETHSRIQNCNDKFYECLNKKAITKADFDFLKAAVRNLSIALDQAEITIGKSQAKEISAKCKSLRDAYFRYKQILTNISPGKPYAPEASGEHAQCHKSLYGELQDLILSINKL